MAKLKCIMPYKDYKEGKIFEENNFHCFYNSMLRCILSLEINGEKIQVEFLDCFELVTQE